MLKKIIFTIIFLTLLTSCGFKKINTSLPIVYFQNINIIGDGRISYLLRNNILLISNENAVDKYDIKIEIKQNESIKIKDKTGDVSRYNTVITLEFVMTNLNTKKNLTKTFSADDDYDVAKNHSNTIGNKKKATTAIIRRLSDEIKEFIQLKYAN